MKPVFLNKFKSLTAYNICWALGFFCSLKHIFIKHPFWYLYTFLNFTQLYLLLFICLIAFLVERKIYKHRNINVENPRKNEIFTQVCLISSFVVFIIYLIIGYDLHRISLMMDWYCNLFFNYKRIYWFIINNLFLQDFIFKLFTVLF